MAEKRKESRGRTLNCISLQRCSSIKMAPYFKDCTSDIETTVSRTVFKLFLEQSSKDCSFSKDVELYQFAEVLIDKNDSLL